MFLKKFKFIMRQSIAIFALAALMTTLIACASAAPAGGVSKTAASTAAETYSRLSGVELADQIAAEGMALVKNEGGALPLNKTDTPRVNVFGWASTQWVASGMGSGQSLSPGRVTAARVGILEALTAYGVPYNPDLTAMYRAFQGRPNVRTPTGGVMFDAKPYDLCRLYEPDINDVTRYTPALKSDALSYSDTAIAVIGRITGETFDAPKEQYKGNNTVGGAEKPEADDKTRTYLEISTEEENLLKYVGENYKNVIVLINSVNVMELGFMDTIPGLDACIVVGGTGADGASAIPKMLYGDVNPSGKLTNAYAYKLNSNANYYTAGADGEGDYAQSAGKGLYPTIYKLNSNPLPGTKETLSYVDYVEDIYVGYKWYETADAEGFWDGKSFNGKSGYEAVVQYPFGYGLSYTDFSWEITKVSPAKNAYLVKDGTVSVDVKVTNTGTKAGKDVVELYYTPPYTKGGIEKSSSNLCAFEKTKLLAPNESQTVTLSFAVEDMASYDCYDKNGNGFAGYELEKGEYQIKLMKDSHTLSPVIGKQKAIIPFFVKSDIRYETDTKSGHTVENRFTGETAEAGVPCDGSKESTPVQYLSRSNFAGTITTERAANRTLTKAVEDLNWFSDERAAAWDAKVGGTAPTTDAATGFKITDATLVPRAGKQAADVNRNVSVDAKLTELGTQLAQDFRDPAWDGLLNQLTPAELNDVPIMGARRTPEILSIGKPATKDPNGPIQANGWGNQDPLGTGFPVTSVMAQSWNRQLCYDFGNAWGTEARETSNAEGWYGPSLNMHRSAFNGRNYEYYSEDAFITGKLVAHTVAGAKDAQVHVYLKHLVIYDTETNRDGLYTWVTEQALREIYLKPFKMAIQAGGATGIMTAYNRIGGLWTGGSPALLTDVVRGEYGFDGAMVSDWPDFPKFMNIDEALRAGGDLWLTQYGGAGTEDPSKGILAITYQYGSRTTPAFQNAQRRAVKCVTFMYLDTKFNRAQFLEGFPIAKANAKAEIDAYGKQYTQKSQSSADEITGRYGAFIEQATDLLTINQYVVAAKAELYGNSKDLTVKGLTGGMIAGIVVLSAVVLAGAAFCVYWFVIRKKKPKTDVSLQQEPEQA